MAPVIRFLLPMMVYSSLFGQVLQTAKPGDAGFSAERLARLDTMFQDYVNNGKVAGVAAIVARNGKVVFHKGVGLRDIAENEPMEKNTIFRIASQTKAITSVAVMMLYENGKLLLDDPVSKYIPEFEDPQVLKDFNPEDSSYTTVPAIREVTVRDLLTHTSGIGYALIGSNEANAIYGKAGIPAGFVDGPVKLESKMKVLADLPLMHQPGKRFTYGLNTDMLGYLVEVVSGQSLADFFHTHIFDPLGMEDTYFYLPKGKQERLAEVYREDEEGNTVEMPLFEKGVSKDYPLARGTYYSGGAGLSSTAEDYAIFLQMLLNGGHYNGKQLLAKSTIRMMTSNQIGTLSLGVNKFGLGFLVVTEKGSTRLPWQEGSFSWDGYFGSHYWADPRQGIVAVLLTQETPNSEWNEIKEKFKVIVYRALAE